jgi:hypothetical protein
MKLGYTEFSYGYAFTENLIRSMPKAPTGAPIFPNLVQEAKVGYDVRIDQPGLPLFFQYKLPELMVRDSAFEISNLNLAGIGVRFFRMKLMRRDLSEQHRLLRRLEKKYPQCVLYAAPLLENREEFNKEYNAARTHERSAFFSPRDIGPLPDDREHSVAYRDGLAFAWLCSDPKRIKVNTYAQVLEDVRALSHEDRFRTLQHASAELRIAVRSLTSEAMRQSESLIEERVRVRRSAIADQRAMPEDREQVVTDILVAREMARIDIGVDVLVAQPTG